MERERLDNITVFMQYTSVYFAFFFKYIFAKNDASRHVGLKTVPACCVSLSLCLSPLSSPLSVCFEDNNNHHRRR